MFFVLVVPLGIVSIGLVISQPVLVGAWCTLCLVTALFMLIMIPFAIDEVVAIGQFMAQSGRQGSPFWRTFWRGGTLESGGAEDTRTPPLGARPLDMARTTAWGISLPWNDVIAGAALVLLSLPRGTVRERYGSWNSFIV